MTSEIADDGSVRSTTRTRGVLGPRPGVVVIAALVMLAVVGVLGYLISSSQDSSRRAAKQQFAASATIRAQLTSSLLSTSATSLRAAAAKVAPSPSALDRLVAASHLGYAAILSNDGAVVASSSGIPAAELRRIGARPAYIRNALEGTSWISGLRPGDRSGKPMIDWAVSFTSLHGRRVIVEGLPVSLLASFLRTFLDQGSTGRKIFVIDNRRGLIASSKSTGLALEAPLPRALARASGLSSRTIGKDFVVSAPVRGTEWTILVAQPTSALYPGLAGSGGWLLWSLVVVAAAIGLAGLVLLRRLLIGSQQIAQAVGELESLNETLEDKVAERMTLAHQRLAELQRSNSELEQFASVAAHDLQEPLRKIRMYGERLGERRELSDDARNDVARMAAASVRLQRLIDDMLDLARVNSRGGALTRVELGPVVADALSDLDARLTEVGAIVEIDELPSVTGDHVQLRRVFQNLLSNALKFHRADEPLRIRVTSEALGDGRCAILVEDNGIGFDEQYAERIFGAFQRLHGRSAFEGTGIGLSIARKIAWRHGGDITATGELGNGATFRVTLPLAPADAISERAAA
jgi:signal transduction histidine kinase